MVNLLINIWKLPWDFCISELILTCSSDNQVVLSSIPSLSSEPFKTIIDDETQSNQQQQQQSPQIEPDRIVKVYEEHEDSVYATEWSSVEPWIFASLSYDGRLVINKVPKEEKFKILL